MARRRRKKQKAPWEFSKKIVVVVFSINIVVIVFSIIMMWRTCDLSPMAYLIPAVAAETATGTGFYYSKAKVENRIKLMKHYNIEPSEQSFNEQGGYYNG
ncbi:MAG: hypothetical protein KHY36_04425 [Subdoligranulum variabile]|jgi:hypothetical protein|uniref:Uncharacterized protein n=1 Tax=Subdoligranulum variabile TaxID=214851 RepID=A0A943HIK5_9FIRM|nr:hypothetical protein [Subdoligranulum variabile]DAG63215.1 MAG TPA: hypothetical protein [Caudoviricetes sp.]